MIYRSMSPLSESLPLQVHQFDYDARRHLEMSMAFLSKLYENGFRYWGDTVTVHVVPDGLLFGLFSFGAGVSAQATIGQGSTSRRFCEKF
jgi:hypothetical protein